MFSPPEEKKSGAPEGRPCSGSGSLRRRLFLGTGERYSWAVMTIQDPHIQVPTQGEKIRMEGGKLMVPERPIIPFVEGDGTGPDIWRASVRVFDAAVQKAYGGARQVVWFEVLAGEKAFNAVNEWLPADTLTAFREYLVGIKGPLTTPVGGGIRSLNVALRQELDLYTCLRPVRYFSGMETPVKRPDLVDMVIFRENTEDIYAGIEWPSGSDEAEKVIDFLRRRSETVDAPGLAKGA